MSFLFLICSCAIRGNKNTAKEETLKNSVQNDNQSVVLTTTDADLADIKNQQMFAYSVYERISRGYKGNMVCSPFGIEMLYSILRDGAQGETYNELNKVLGITHTEASSMMKDIELPSDTTGTTIVMANLIAVNKPYTLKQAFASSARRDYGAEIWSRAFNDGTLIDINRWIEKKTSGMIPTGLDNLDASSVMCGINTIYFNGKWNEPFNENATLPTVFTNSTGKKVKVMMMSQRSHFQYMKTKSFQVLAMPYRLRMAKGARMKNYSLYIFLPLPGKDFSAILNYIKGKPTNEVKSEMIIYGRAHYDNPLPMVNVKFPRMEVTSRIDVVSVMKSLGVKTSFSLNADFGKISGNAVYISNSQQKAVIRIDEEGTEAAAMTDVFAVLGAAEGHIVKRPKEAFFYANRPFIYMIVCEDTNTILFIGRYTDGMIKNNRGVWVSDSNIKGANVLSYRADEVEYGQVQQTSENIHADDYVYNVVERMPEFPGGTSQLMSFLLKNTCYPVDAVKDKIEGRVVLTFIVEKDGRLTDIKVAKSVNPSLDKESIRIVKSMPKWNPGMQDGMKVRAKYTLPISFKLDGMPMKKH